MISLTLQPIIGLYEKDALKRDLKFLGVVGQLVTKNLKDEISDIPKDIAHSLARAYINTFEKPTETQVRYFEAKIHHEVDESVRTGIRKKSMSTGTPAHLIASQNEQKKRDKAVIEMDIKGIKMATENIIRDLLSSEDS